uniref:Uncharacterized protein n=1 Tax=viral metagenome TaxID=1070528 RepID=A0A6C0L1E8_9ZZZZ|tara:strand:- start:10241 stop:10819 length:579 start_codon:yes stop_codon:yes gene_type:complete
MMVVETLIIIISICVLWTQTYIQDWKSVFLFLFVVSLCHYVLETPVYVSFGLAGILSCVMNVTLCRVENYSESGIKNLSEDDESSSSDADPEDAQDEDDEDDSKPIDDNPIDMGSTIKDALQNFDPKTLKNMTKDTTSLIKQQTELMNVISQMQPVISKGLSLVDKFHGDGKTEKLFKQYSELSKLKKSIEN